jgi:uncharacterized membrane protein YhaH (DUF805 family)
VTTIGAPRTKRGAVVLALAALAMVIFALPSFLRVMIANSLMAVVDAVFGPAVAAPTMGLYVRK